MERVLDYFYEICAIPHGSGNMDAISSYCVNFAEKRDLFCHRDEANNVIIKKEGRGKGKNAPPLILQGHLDMVCQKEEKIFFDFEKDGILPFKDGDLIRARGTTLGADNGIAVAMILALLERNEGDFPPIEAVFTTDEEIGMVGAKKLSPHLLSAKRMINLDGESDLAVTVSCAGGVDLTLQSRGESERKSGFAVEFSLSGLKGGHSGVEIHKNRANAALLCGKILARVYEKIPFFTVSLSSGEKSNAIPFWAKARVLTESPAAFSAALQEECEKEKAVWLPFEEGFDCEISSGKSSEEETLSRNLEEKLYGFFREAETGVVSMSEKIKGLVETSYNLGILSVSPKGVKICYSLRSSVTSELEKLKKSLSSLGENHGFEWEEDGFYPPWEYREDSPLREVYSSVFLQKRGSAPKIESIHAGLECGVFAGLIPDLDCISIGPDLFEIHSPREAMSISSVERLYEILKEVLEKLS